MKNEDLLMILLAFVVGFFLATIKKKIEGIAENKQRLKLVRDDELKTKLQMFKEKLIEEGNEIENGFIKGFEKYYDRFIEYLRDFHNVGVHENQSTMVGAFFSSTTGKNGCPAIPAGFTHDISEFDVCRGTDASPVYGAKRLRCVLVKGDSNYCDTIKPTNCNKAGDPSNEDKWDAESIINAVGHAEWCNHWADGININRGMNGNTALACSPDEQVLDCGVGFWGQCCKKVKTCKPNDAMDNVSIGSPACPGSIVNGS